MAWTIKGDAAVTVATVGGVTYGMNATERTFASLKAKPKLQFQCLADDVLTYSVPTENAKGKGTIVPREGQELHVYDESNVRIFKGHVVRPVVDLSSVKVTAYGPWWWMGKIKLSGELTDATGGKAERAGYGFPEQGLRLSFRTLINRAVDMGVPMKKVTDDDESSRISAMFTMMKTTFSDVTFAAAFAEMMSMVGDAVAYFDYSSTPPAICIKRRDAMSPVSYAIGATGSVRVKSAPIYPRTDLEVKRVQLHYMKRRAGDGRPKWASKNFGSASSDDDKRKIQIVTVSGPETLQILPKDSYESMTVQTSQVALNLTWAFAYDNVIQDAVKRFGRFVGSPTTNINIANAYYLQKGEVREWMRKDHAIKTRDVRVTGWIRFTEGPGGGYGPIGTFLKGMGRLRHYPSAGYYEVYVDYTIPVINKAYPKKTTLYKAWDYDFMEPPDGLAESLRNAQNWVPWEGTVEIIRPDLSGYNGLQRKFNLTNGNPDCATMDALVKSITYDVATNRVIWELGPPPRIDLGGLVNKLRRNPQDNIKWL